MGIQNLPNRYMNAPILVFAAASSVRVRRPTKEVARPPRPIERRASSNVRRAARPWVESAQMHQWQNLPHEAHDMVASAIKDHEPDHEPVDGLRVIDYAVEGVRCAPATARVADSA